MNRKQIIVLCVAIVVLVGGVLVSETFEFSVAERIALAAIMGAIGSGLVYVLKDKNDINFVEYICNKLAHLASMKMQKRYMANATKDEYLLPSELLEDGFSVVEAVEKHWGRSVSLHRSDRQAVIEFGKVLKKEYELIDLNEVALEEIVSNNEPWANIREAAQKCIGALGFDLEAWEKEQLSE
ncbi:MAG: hypothetical protein GY845_14790 [Planctomycetes bacterium]|nr:hypothetical protein [Planctomycetota bacterium]